MLTLADFARQAAMQALSALGQPATSPSLDALRVGGLRAGWGGLDNGSLILARLLLRAGRDGLGHDHREPRGAAHRRHRPRRPAR